jgi:deferrochelatase/peroxidase EfeB
MSKNGGPEPQPSRRALLAAAAGLAVAGPSAAAAAPATSPSTMPEAVPGSSAIEPFWGLHQSGIATAVQNYTFFAALDLAAKKPGDVVDLLRDWTAAAARLMQGNTAAPLGNDLSVAASDSGEALDLGPARLTLTFGFGPGLFVKDGKDRYGWAASRPAALVDLPRFNGDQLQLGHTGGDLSVQACADDPQVAFHAVRQLVRLAYGRAELRWTQAGFATTKGKGTPRNLMGFKDGTVQPRNLDAAVWVGEEGSDWMRGGSYLVVRKIRIALEHWDRTPVDFQEQVVGRHKYSGAPLGGKDEFEPLDLAAADSDGNPVIPENAHVRLATAASNDGAQILRRAFSYNDGTNFTAERWPPWRQGIEYDAGLFFVSYQRDPRTGFIKIFDKMSKLDMMNQFTTHIGSGIFACPRGPREGEFLGERLFRPT